MGKTPVANTFDRVAASFEASQGTSVTATNYVLSGLNVRLLQTAHLSEVIALKKGGPFMEVVGPTAKDLLDFVRAYLAANG
jgi:hypothetical protein